MKKVRRTWRRVEAMQLPNLMPTVLHEHLDQVQCDLAAVNAAVAKQHFHRHRNHAADAAQ